MPRDYAYIVARLRAIEAAGPDQAWFDRLARSPLDSVKAVAREHYRGFESLESLDMFEDALEQEKLWTLDLITGVLSDDAVSGFLRAGYDFDNLLHAWKAARLSREPRFSPFGVVDPEAIEKAAAGTSIADLPSYLKNALEGLQAFEGISGVAEGSCYAEKMKWRFLMDAAPSRKAADHVRHCIDIANIKAFIRIKGERFRSDMGGAAWIPGGEIEPWTLGVLLKEPPDEFFNYLAYTSYRGLIAGGLEQGTPAWKTDALLRLEILERMGDGRYGSFDIMPVIDHIERADLRIAALRVIITGKLAALPDEIISERAGAFAQ